MKALILILGALLLLLAPASAGASNAVSLGYSEETTIVGPGPDACASGVLIHHLDGSFENGYGWQYAGVVPPYFGAFGEGCHIPNWPNVGQNDVEMSVPVPGPFTVGYWGPWPGGYCWYFCGADLDGPPGDPWTCVAPGIGYPLGWQDPSIIWRPTTSIGCGAYFEADPTPAASPTWGAIKAMFRE